MKARSRGQGPGFRLTGFVQVALPQGIDEQPGDVLFPALALFQGGKKDGGAGAHFIVRAGEVHDERLAR